MMRLLDIKEYENMPVNKWGIREPGEVYDQRGNRREDGESSLLFRYLFFSQRSKLTDVYFRTIRSSHASSGRFDWR